MMLFIVMLPAYTVVDVVHCFKGIGPFKLVGFLNFDKAYIIPIVNWCLMGPPKPIQTIYYVVQCIHK